LDHQLGAESVSSESRISGSLETNHVFDASKDAAIGAAAIPFQVKAESGAVGAAIPALAAVKGTAVGSAVAAPIILKAVALPGVAAGKTAALLATPHLLTSQLKSVPEQLFHNLNASFDLSGLDWKDNIAGLYLIEDPQELANEGLFELNKDTDRLTSTVGLIKAGALGLKAGTVGLAAKGIIAAKAAAVGAVKKAKYIVARVILKPAALVAGAHLKMLGTGLALGGKLVGGTGAGIAKAGTAVKYVGLGSLGLGASAIGWGLDKSTISTHFEESNRQ